MSESQPVTHSSEAPGTAEASSFLTSPTCAAVVAGSGPTPGHGRRGSHGRQMGAQGRVLEPSGVRARRASRGNLTSASLWGNQGTGTRGRRTNVLAAGPTSPRPSAAPLASRLRRTLSRPSPAASL